MKSLFILSFLSIIAVKSYSQGCVAIRSNGGTCAMSEPGHNSKDGNWAIGINHRYFRSFRHYAGADEQKQRVALGTEVVNYANTTELSLTRILNDRWSFLFSVPIVDNNRSSLYEHSGVKRYSTHAFGLGDVRIAAYRWMLDPMKHYKANIQLGLGIKLPTGDYRFQDYFYKNDSTKTLGPVDQSIQLGDGGTGISLELNAFYHFSPKFSVYGNAYYLINPREQNGVSTARGGTPSASAVLYGSDVMSVPDQYMWRTGATYSLKHLTLSGGVRMECIPSEDLVGGSNGFRRPGYVISAEPVVAYKVKKTQFYVSVPAALIRNRTQSVPDKLQTTKTKVYRIGDAAFADYSVNFGVSFMLK
jgi:hypothetical protein